METWRLIATVLLVVAGLVLVLLAMAKVRDRKAATGGQVALTGAIAFTVLVVLSVLTITVLPAWLAWGLVVVVGVTVSALMLAS